MTTTLRKLSHSCVRLEGAGRPLVLDPGSFSPAGETVAAMSGAGAVLITHEHPDHVDPAALVEAVEADADLRIWAPASVAATLRDEHGLGDVVTAVGAGEELDVAGHQVRTFGGQHALIHSSIPVVSNVAYLVDGEVYHPGDSFTVPTEPVSLALVPIHAPWSKVAEVVDFLVALGALRAVAIHDLLLSETGLAGVGAVIDRCVSPYDVAYARLQPGETTELG